MKTTIKTISLCALMLMGIVAVAQQRGGTPEQRAQRQTEMLKSKLNLTDEQSQKVQAVLVNSIAEMQKARQAKIDSTLKGPSKELIDKRNEELKKVLTKEQYEKYIQLPMATGTRGPRGPMDGRRPRADKPE